MMPATTSALVTPGLHWSGGAKYRPNSWLNTPVESVPSSGRPICTETCLISGCLAKYVRRSFDTEAE